MAALPHVDIVRLRLRLRRAVGLQSNFDALPRRSLQIQTGDVRFNWSHGIKKDDLPQQGRRVSITFRHSKLT